MQATYKVSADEYAKAMKLSGRHSLKYYVIFLAVLIVGVSLFLSRSLPVMGTVVGVGVAVLVWYLVRTIVRHGIMPLIHKRHYRKYKAIQGEMTVRVDGDGIEVSSEDGRWKLPWGKTHKWREDSDFILVYSMPRLFYVIPKVVDGPDFEIGRLRELLSKHVGPAT